MKKTKKVPAKKVEKFQGKGALDAFLNLLSLVTLGWLAITYGRLLFILINKYYSPSFIDYQSVAYYQSGLKFCIASIIIITPIFFGVSAYLHNQYKQKKLNHESGIYRWLTYLMLLVSALNIIGSLVAVIFRLLDGDYALGTILKIATVFFIACAIFSYYFYDLRRRDYEKKSLVSVLSSIAVIIILIVSVVGSFLIIDPPQVSRMKNFDLQRVNHLFELEGAINGFYQDNKGLPSSLDREMFLSYMDPETKKPYEYRKINETRFELCASFGLAIDPKEYNQAGGSKNWVYHGAGRQCFESEVYSQIKVIEGKTIPIVEPVPEVIQPLN